jgi:Family of unknown function (DUF5522)
MTEELLVEGIDYYMENGFMVFTAVYLQKRGFCCRSGCRHCPYGFVKEQEVSKPAMSPKTDFFSSL